MGRAGTVINAHRGPTITRSHKKIIEMLFQGYYSGRPVTREELADATGMTVRSAMRRLTEIKHLGIPVMTVGMWGETKYQLPSEWVLGQEKKYRGAN